MTSLVYTAFCGWEVFSIANRFKHADIMWIEVNALWVEIKAIC